MTSILLPWIDALNKVWEFDHGRGGNVISYRLSERDNFPEALGDLSTPVALTFIRGMSPQYSRGGPNIVLWRGVTEFHLAPDLNKARLPYINGFFWRILEAAAANMKLGGLVEHFLLQPGDGDAIQGPVEMQYGSESPHYGLVVSWEVKERVSGLTVGDPSVS